MKANRRSFFGMLGLAGAASAAGVPEPRTAEKMDRETIYTITFPDMSKEQLDFEMNWIRSQTEPLGIKVIFMPESFNISHVWKDGEQMHYGSPLKAYASPIKPCSIGSWDSKSVADALQTSIREGHPVLADIRNNL